MNYVFPVWISRYYLSAVDYFFKPDTFSFVAHLFTFLIFFYTQFVTWCCKDWTETWGEKQIKPNKNLKDNQKFKSHQDHFKRYSCWKPQFNEYSCGFKLLHSNLPSISVVCTSISVVSLLKLQGYLPWDSNCSTASLRASSGSISNSSMFSRTASSKVSCVILRLAILHRFALQSSRMSESGPVKTWETLTAIKPNFLKKEHN